MFLYDIDLKMNLRYVLSGTDQLRQHLLQAIDRLDDDFQRQQRQQNRTSVSVATTLAQDRLDHYYQRQHRQQNSNSISASTTLAQGLSSQPAGVPLTSQTVGRSATMPPPFQISLPLYSQSSFQLPSTSFTPISSSASLESQISSLLTDPHRQTFLWNPRSTLGKRGPMAYKVEVRKRSCRRGLTPLFAWQIYLKMKF